MKNIAKAVFLSGLLFIGYDSYAQTNSQKIGGIEKMILEGLERKSLDYEETSLPNAMYIVSRDSIWNSLHKEESIEFLKQIDEFYDLKISSVKNKIELYKSIIESKNLDLLIIAGHANPVAIRLSEKVDSESILDITDKGARGPFSQLKEGSTILFYGANVARKISDERKNFILTMHEYASHLRMLGPSQNFDEVEIDNFYPLKVSFYNKNNLVEVVELPAKISHLEPDSLK